MGRSQQWEGAPEDGLDDSSMELIRHVRPSRGGTTSTPADALDDLSVTPALARDVEDTRANVALVRTWLAVVDQVGWPIANG
jgi:hypothetical protein